MLDIEYKPTPWMTGEELSGPTDILVAHVEVVAKNFKGKDGKEVEVKVLRFHTPEGRFLDLSGIDSNNFVRDYGADEEQIIGKVLRVFPAAGSRGATFIKVESLFDPEE